MKMTTKIFCFTILCAITLAFLACASSGSFRGLTVEPSTIEVFPQVGHPGSGFPYPSMAYSPDGKYIVTGGGDTTVKIWDIDSGRELKTLFGHTNAISDVAYSPDGKYIASAALDSANNGVRSTIKIWDAGTGQELRSLSTSGSVLSVVYSPDGKRIVSGSGTKKYNSLEYTVLIWDADSGRVLQTLVGHTHDVHSVAYSSDGKHIVSGSWDKTVKVWDAESGKLLRTLSGHAGFIDSAEYSPDGKRIVSISNDYEVKNQSTDFSTSTIKVWDAESGQELQSFSGHTEYGRGVMFTPDGKCIISWSNDNTIKIWDAENGQELRTLFKCASRPISVMFSPDGRCIVFGCADRTFKMLHFENGSEIQSFFTGIDEELQSVVFSPNGKNLISVSDKKCRIWNVENGRLLGVFTDKSWLELTQRNIQSAAYSPDGKRIVSGFNGQIRMWNAENGEQMRFAFVGWAESCSVAYSSDGKYIASGGRGNTIKIWDAEKEQLVRTISWQTKTVQPASFVGVSMNLSPKFVSSVSFSPNGKRIVSVSSFTYSTENTVKIWDTESGQELRTLSAEGILSIAYSPNGKYLVSGSQDKTVKLWDAESGKLLKTLRGHTGNVTSVAFSSDGKRVVSSGGEHLNFDKNIRVWDAKSGRLLKTLSGHSSNVQAVAFSPDGKRIVSTSEDGTTRLWDTSTGKEIVKLISVPGSDTQLATATRGLTVETATAATSNEGEWLSITPEGFYQASSRGDRYLNVRVGNTVSGIDSYRSVFYNPDVVQARLQGKKDPASKGKVTIKQVANFTPPQVTIKSPASGSATNTAQANLSVTVSDQNQPLKNIRVFVNGRSAGKAELAAIKGDGLQVDRTNITVTGNQKTVNFTMPLALDPGPNRIEVVAFNGYSDTRRYVDVVWNAPAGIKPALPNLWILAVGVNGYDNAGLQLGGLGNLGFCVADAKGLIDSLKAQEGRRYAKVNSLLIADGEAVAPTAANIRQNLKFLDQAGDRDVVLFFLAGHGISAQEGKFFFLTKDALFSGDRVVDASKAISGDELVAVLEGQGNRLLFIDACQSGGVDNDRMVRALQESNAFVFAASQGYELSYEDPRWGHGAFTYSILNALKGAPAALAEGNVSVRSMSGFVSIEVPKLTGNRQNPKVHSLLYSDFPMAVIK